MIANVSLERWESDGFANPLCESLANRKPSQCDRRYSGSVSGRVVNAFGQVLIIRCSYVMAESAVG